MSRGSESEVKKIFIDPTIGETHGMLLFIQRDPTSGNCSFLTNSASSNLQLANSHSMDSADDLLVIRWDAYDDGGLWKQVSWNTNYDG